MCTGLPTVLRHANCTHVAIDLSVESDRLVMQVRDNGPGLKPIAEANGHGLASMGDRARRLGGTLDIPADGQGTAVTLEVPLRSRPT